MKEIFVKNPNIPQNRVSKVIMSDFFPKFTAEMERLGISVVTPGRLDDITLSESFHSDMNVCHLGNNKFIAAKNNFYLINKLKELNADVTLSAYDISGQYPQAAALNVCIIGNSLICNTKSVDKNILGFCRRNSYKILHTNQGYTKCSSAVISDSAIITSDESIYNICIKNKIDVLKISSGYIELVGYNYGFIGGACGLINKNTLAFCGNIKTHKNYENIRDFSKNYGVSLISLSGGPLCDIGGILPIKEAEIILNLN